MLFYTYNNASQICQHLKPKDHETQQHINFLVHQSVPQNLSNMQSGEITPKLVQYVVYANMWCMRSGNFVLKIDTTLLSMKKLASRTLCGFKFMLIFALSYAVKGP